MYRHGDVMIAKTDSVPPGALRRPSVVLARGEATGHSHRIADAEGISIFEFGGVGYLTIEKEFATLVHDEHGPIQLAGGTYRFWQQREYSPKEIRQIRD